ncbi:right-handed parallel beta-helix repeat-containing protein [Burkholderia sp. Ac-20345]|uniref:right-handed parallel beta-helix repeat-containing protein n=1 Tax=Burkholderia sp. Ac-20345 TaxID=2703891 RepID=UPI001F11CF71|nr:right-handed parallel beta-helix repeat-containing protein [Burkholderia sp. Ac-20345]
MARIAQALPVVTVRPTANGGDQTDALQAAFNALLPGQRLVLAPGTYAVSRSLNVAQANVVISGYGATLVASNPNDQTLVMSGRGSTLVGVTLIGTGTTRLATRESTKVEVTGTDIQVLDVTIRGGASAGIFVYGGTNVAIVNNTVQSTLADGIHTTYGSTNVRVEGNTVKDTGDDLIAVVSYQADGRISGNVLIDHNSVSGNYWGRGIAVVGGQSVTISNNTIDGVQKASGILVAQEASWNTYDATNVIVSGNTVSNIQNSNVNNGLQPTQLGALRLSAWPGTVSSVAVTNNKVSGSGYAGFQAEGNICQFSLTGDAFSSISGVAVAVLASGCTPTQMVVAGNTLDGVALVPPVGTSKSGLIQVSGAATATLPTVRWSLMQTTGSSARMRE